MKGVAILIITLMVVTVGFSKGNGYQQHYRFLSKYPDREQVSDYTSEGNGIAHDDNYWYFTNNDYEDLEALWKIPVTRDLGDIESNTSGVTVVRSDDFTCPTNDGIKNLRDDLGYDHLGDLDAYKAADQQYYLVIPIENGMPGHGIAVFRADNLQCLGYDVLWINTEKTVKIDAAAWCAVDPQGYVYSSPDKWNVDNQIVIFKYSMNWSSLGLNPQYPVQLTYLETIVLKNETGGLLSKSEISGHAQGGEFSSNGKLLYLCAGSTQMDEEEEAYGGIHVFDTQTWRRVARSHNSGSAFFKYDFNSGSAEYEEPEGLTIWDLDANRSSFSAPQRAPNIEGQLHVMLLQNYVAATPGAGDGLYVYHYTNTMYVDRSYTDEDSDGTLSRPYMKLGDALAYYNQYEFFNYGRWTGGRIKIQTGSYDEALTISHRVQIIPWSGEAVIGSNGFLSLRPGCAVNIEDGGVLKIY